MHCQSCRAPNANNAKFCTNCGASLTTVQDTPYQAPASSHMHNNFASAFIYGGFWRRFFAYIVDGIIVYVLMLMISIWGFGASFNIADPQGAIQQVGIVFLLYYLVWWMYYAIQESSAKQATLGKRLLGIKVCDMSGQRLSFPHAAGRQLAGAISSITFTIGYLMAAFTGRKQALHDMIAGCVVVKKHFDGAQVQSANLSPPAGMSITAILGVVALVLIVPVGGIIAAIALPAYHDYTVRAQVSEAYIHAMGATENIVNYAEDTGYWPQNFEQAQLNTEDFRADNYHMQIGPDGELSIKFTKPQQISTGVLRLKPELTTESGYKWQCTGEKIKESYLPAKCRNLSE